MYTHKDISVRTIFVLNCIDKERHLKVKGGELFLEERVGETNKTLTKFPFQKLLALFIIGPITITTPLIDKCKKYGVALVVMKMNLRPVFVWANSAEANYLLRKRQYNMKIDDISIAKLIVCNKIENQKNLLIRSRKKDELTIRTIGRCDDALTIIKDIKDYSQLMGVEGQISKMFFGAYFQKYHWKGRHPRTKCDAFNLVLDIGYTILFNFLEVFMRMFGFDLYIGVYHRLWFKRKSLICDLIEPFRCIIDHIVLLSFNKKQFKISDFEIINNQYILKKDCCAKYYKIFFDELISRKSDVFTYVQKYYRCFMGCKSSSNYPKYEYK